MKVKIWYREIEWDVEADISPDEPATHDYPGCGGSCDITCISHNGTDFSCFFMEYGTKKEISDVLSEFEQLIYFALADAYDPDYGMDWREDR